MNRRQRKSTLVQARRPTSAAQAGLLLLAVLVLLIFVGPTSVPVPMWVLAALSVATLAAVVAMLAMREYGGRYNTLRVGRFGRWHASKILGLVVFVLIVGWWLSPWSPMHPF